MSYETCPLQAVNSLYTHHLYNKNLKPTCLVLTLTKIYRERQPTDQSTVLS